jgi:hypothetical protein
MDAGGAEDPEALTFCVYPGLRRGGRVRSLITGAAPTKKRALRDIEWAKIAQHEAQMLNG